MFDTFRERLQTVQHDLTQGWKSIADKAKAVNKKIVRKTTFITDEILESEDQCFNCNLEAGSEILNRYCKNWREFHEATTDAAQRGEVADRMIARFAKQCTDLSNTMTAFHRELELLPEVIRNIETARTDIAAIGNQLEVLDVLMIDLEESCERLDLERRKSTEKLKLTMMRQSKEDDLEKLREELELEKELKEEEHMALVRQASIEKQQVYGDAFLEQMNYYIQFGKTDEQIAMQAQADNSLADITLDDDADLHKQLDDFLGPETEAEVPTESATGLSSALSDGEDSALEKSESQEEEENSEVKEPVVQEQESS